MSICTPIPRTDLLANFVQVNPVVTANLGALVIGPDYAVRRYTASTDGSASGTGYLASYSPVLTPSNAAASGVAAVNWPGKLSTEAVDTTWTKAYVVDALVKYYTESGAPGATRGSMVAGQTNQIQHNAGATVFSGAGFTTSLNVEVAVGDVVYLEKNDSVAANTLLTTVTAILPVSNQNKILVLADTLPTALQSGNFNLNICQVAPTPVVVATGNVTQTASTIALTAGITASTDRTVTAYPVIGGTTLAGRVYSRAYTSFRGLRTVLSSSMQSLTSASELPTYFVGYTDVDSGLGFSVARALGPATSGNPAVYFLAVPTNDLTGWTSATGLVSGRPEWSVLSAVTTDESTVLQVVLDMLAYRQTIGMASHFFHAPALTYYTTLGTGAGYTVTVSGGTTVLASAGAPFAAVVAGDLITIAGTEYVVASKTSSQQITLASAAANGSGIAVTLIRHPLTVSEQVTDWTARVVARKARYYIPVFPPAPEWEGVATYGYHLASALAGTRGFTAPQQAIRGAELEAGWTGASQVDSTFASYRLTLAAAGATTVSKSTATNTVLVDLARGSQQDTAIDMYEALVANANTATRYIQSAVACLEGRRRITSATLGEVEAAARVALSTLVNSSGLAGFGPVCVGGAVGTASQNQVQSSQIDLPVTLEIAGGLETLSITTSVTLQTL